MSEVVAAVTFMFSTSFALQIQRSNTVHNCRLIYYTANIRATTVNNITTYNIHNV